jgi:MFS family permease
MITVSGRLMDICGRRWIMIIGNLFGVIGCIVAGAANSVGVAITGISIIGCEAGIRQQASACLAGLVLNKYRRHAGSPLLLMGFAVLGTFILYHPPSFQQKHSLSLKTKMLLLIESVWGGSLCGEHDRSSAWY